MLKTMLYIIQEDKSLFEVGDRFSFSHVQIPNKCYQECIYTFDYSFLDNKDPFEHIVINIMPRMRIYGIR